MCTSYIDKGGEEKKIDDQKLQEIQKKVISSFASQAYRTLTIAYKEISVEEFDKVNKDDDMSDSDEGIDKLLESELTLI
jgi:magnesium-transporting ATPase (P-type)